MNHTGLCGVLACHGCETFQSQTSLAADRILPVSTPPDFTHVVLNSRLSCRFG